MKFILLLKGNPQPNKTICKFYHWNQSNLTKASSSHQCLSCLQKFGRLCIWLQRQLAFQWGVAILLGFGKILGFRTSQILFPSPKMEWIQMKFYWFLNFLILII